MGVNLAGLSYLGLRVPDVDAFHDYATGVIGLMPARTGADGVYLKADDRSWRIALEPGEPGLAYAGFEVVDATAFATAADALDAAGVTVTAGTSHEIATRNVRDLVWTTDPSGVRIEIVWGPSRDGGFASPVGVPSFVTGALGLGHYVLLVPDMNAALDFYQRVLGLRLTDYVDIGPKMSVQFLRCNARHHSVALTAVGPISALHHIAFEVPDIDQVGLALDRATRAGCEITASLGRHKNDRMLSFYMRTPAGFEVEIGCDGIQVDDATWVTNAFTGGDDWGHHGLSADAMAASGQ
jgi:3,4-dihydroxy-9,10-secoandrosta-1,3,5(10)-triene-9,17-dione 4,5-dioxygenase